MNNGWFGGAERNWSDKSMNKAWMWGKWGSVLLLLCSGFSATAVPQDEDALTGIREGFYAAVLDGDSTPVLLSKIERISAPPPLIQAYRGAAEALMARNQWNPFTAFRYLKLSRTTLTAAVAKDPGNIEIRFLRFAVQRNIPSYLGFSRNLDEDRDFIYRNLDQFHRPDLSPQIREYIMSFLAEQGGYTDLQVKHIREKMVP
ncbi:MAG: hypothetical protein AAGB22_09650 [Bacteroidota bacterium]